MTVPYVEPTHAARTGRAASAPPFVAEFVVEADDEEQARARALERFEADARDSGVGWIREPLEDQVRVRPA